MTKKVETIMATYINGNITTAKKQAKRIPMEDIRQAFMDYGYSEVKATLTAAHIKGADCWQAACDAE